MLSLCCFSAIRLSDASGSMNFELIAEGEISKDMLDTNVSLCMDMRLSQALV